MQPKTFDEHLVESRKRAHRNRVVQQRYPIGTDEWTAELAVAEAALAMLWQTVKTTRATDFRREQILWRRHHDDLWQMKRWLDAVVM